MENKKELRIYSFLAISSFIITFLLIIVSFFVNIQIIESAAVGFFIYFLMMLFTLYLKSEAVKE